MSIKHSLLPLLFLILIFITPANAIFTLTASLEPGTEFYVNNLKAIVDLDKRYGRSMLIVNGTHIIEGEEKTIAGITFKVMTFKNKTIVSITSNKPFELTFTRNENIDTLKARIRILEEQNEQLKNENKQLKRRISELEKQLSQAKAQDVSKLKAQINNLTKENRELKSKLANITTSYNKLKAKAEFLEQQNNEYRTLLSKLIEEQAKKSEQKYIEKAKKERLIGSIIMKSLIFSLIVVVIIGYGLYRKKRSWEFGGL
nr:hypothetical protein [Pyrococcus abyssi]